MSAFLLWDGYQLKTILGLVIMKNYLNDLFQLCYCQVRMVLCLMTHIQLMEMGDANPGRNSGNG